MATLGLCLFLFTNRVHRRRHRLLAACAVLSLGGTLTGVELTVDGRVVFAPWIGAIVMLTGAWLYHSARPSLRLRIAQAGFAIVAAGFWFDAMLVARIGMGIAMLGMLCELYDARNSRVPSQLRAPRPAAA